MTQNVVTVSAAIQLALTNQRKTIDAVNATNEAIESMVLSNSQALKQNTEETTKLAKTLLLAWINYVNHSKMCSLQLKHLKNRQNVLSSQVRSSLLN